MKINNIEVIAEIAADLGLEVITCKFNTYGNLNGIRTLDLIVDRSKGTIKWGTKEFKVNKKLIKVSKVRDENHRLVDKCEIATVGATINLIIKTLESKGKYPNKALKFLNELKGTVLRSDWEISDELVSTDYNLGAIQEEDEFTVDVQQVLRDNAVVCFHVDSRGLMLSGKKYSWVEGCLEVVTKAWGFALPDKTNTKRAIVGDAVVVSGRSKDGKLSIVKDEKVTKQLNREAMIKHIAAEIPNVSNDALVSKLSNGKLALSYGFAAQSLLINDPLLSASSGDAQIVNRKPISFTVNKLLTCSVNLDLLFVNNEALVAEVEKKGVSRKDQVEVVIAKIKETLLARQLSNPLVGANEAIVFEGQAILINSNVFPVNLFKVEVRRGVSINTECRTIEISVHCKAHFEDYNVKLRGQWVKGMTGKVDGYQVKGAEKAQLILNHNSIKNEKAVALRAWANAHSCMIAWTAEGELRHVNEEMQVGELVDLEAVEKDLVEMTKLYEVTNVISKEDYETFRSSSPEAFSQVKNIKVEGEIVTLTYNAYGIEAPLVYAIELSSVQENLSLNRRVSPDRASFLTTFNLEVAERKLGDHMSRLTKTMEEAASKVKPEIFNINNAGERAKLVELLSTRVKLPTRDLFKALGQAIPNGIKIVAETKEGTRTCEATLNLNLLSKLGAFRNDGYSHNETIKEVHALLGLIVNKTSALNLIVDYVMKLGKALKSWKKDITTQDKAFTKGNPLFTTHGMKVLSASVVKDSEGNYLPSYEKVIVEGKETVVPILWVNSNNPLALEGTRDKLGNKVKPIRSGDIGLGYRNPMLDLIPIIIRFNNEACDKFTCAASPSVLAWSSQTDNDGDTLWVIPAKQFCVNNVDGDSELAIASKKALVEMLVNHPLVGKEVAIKTMAAFGCDDLFAGIVKSRKNFNVIERVNGEVTTVIGESNCEIVELAEKVAKHYRERIGQGYAMMFNAYNSFVRKYKKGGGYSEFTEAEILATKACSFVFYEEVGLAGYSEANENVFLKVDSLAKRLLGKIKAKSGGLPGQALHAKNHSDVWYFAAFIRAQGMVQSNLESGKLEVDNSKVAVKVIIDEAVNNGLFRTLTKGYLNYQGDNVSDLFAINFVVDNSHPYAPAMTAWNSFVKSDLIVNNVG